MDLFQTNLPVFRSRTFQDIFGTKGTKRIWPDKVTCLDLCAINRTFLLIFILWLQFLFTLGCLLSSWWWCGLLSSWWWWEWRGGIIIWPRSNPGTYPTGTFSGGVIPPQFPSVCDNGRMAAIQVWNRPQAVSFETKDGYRKRSVPRAEHPELNTRFREMSKFRPDKVGHGRISTKNGDFRHPVAERRAVRIHRRFQGKPRRGIESGGSAWLPFRVWLPDSQNWSFQDRKKSAMAKAFRCPVQSRYRSTRPNAKNTAREKNQRPQFPSSGVHGRSPGNPRASSESLASGELRSAQAPQDSRKWAATSPRTSAMVKYRRKLAFSEAGSGM